jgi:hypothetical protein
MDSRIADVGKAAIENMRSRLGTAASGKIDSFAGIPMAHE